MVLTHDDIARFAEQGFLVLGKLVSPEELSWLRSLCDEVFAAHFGAVPAELAQSDARHGRGSVLTLVSPEAYAPRLLGAELLARTTSVAASLLRSDPSDIVRGMRFFVKPGHYGPTAWHQDAAYRPPPHDGLSVWVPLDDATHETGCMGYLPGSHRGQVQSHHIHDAHMVIDRVDARHAAFNPVPAGFAIAHHTRTIHAARSNLTAGPRRALVIVFAPRARIPAQKERIDAG